MFIGPSVKEDEVHVPVAASVCLKLVMPFCIHIVGLFILYASTAAGHVAATNNSCSGLSVRVRQFTPDSVSILAAATVLTSGGKPRFSTPSHIPETGPGQTLRGDVDAPELGQAALEL